MASTDIRNLLRDLPAAGPDEHFEALLERPGLRVERIVSHGHITPPGEWYDQANDEWVVVLRGEAGLRLADEPRTRRLGPGDWLRLPAGCRHRVEWTTADGPTVWLALHHQAEGGDR